MNDLQNAQDAYRTARQYARLVATTVDELPIIVTNEPERIMRRMEEDAHRQLEAAANELAYYARHAIATGQVDGPATNSLAALFGSKRPVASCVLAQLALKLCA